MNRCNALMRLGALSLLCSALLFPSFARADEPLTATITNAQINDFDGDGFADLGDRIRYTVIVQNPTPAPVSGVTLNLTASGAQHFAPGSLFISQGVATEKGLSSLNGFRLKIELGTVAAGAAVTVTYDSILNYDFELVPTNTQFPLSGNYSFGSLVAADGSSRDIDTSPVVNLDFDNDGIDDGHDACLSARNSSPRLNLVLPANGPGPFASVSHTIHVTDHGPITQLALGIQGTHTYVGDLVMKLTHVNTGRTVVLMDQPGFPANPEGGCPSNDFFITFFNSVFGSPVETMCNSSSPAISGAVLSEQSLASFNGEDQSGDWTLTVEDHYPAVDGGSLNQWCLKFATNTSLSTSFNAPPTVLSDQHFSQRFTVRNDGPSDIDNLHASFRLPTGLELVRLQTGNSITVDFTGLTSSSENDDGLRFTGGFGPLPIGQSVTVDLEVAPAANFPYRELIVSSSGPAAGTHLATIAPSGPDIPSAGINAKVVTPRFSTAPSCELQNPGEVAGAIVLLSDSGNNCEVTVRTAKAKAAGAVAAAVPVASASDASAVFVLPEQGPVLAGYHFVPPFPILGLTNSEFAVLLAESQPMTAVLRSNPQRVSWPLRSTAAPLSSNVGISGNVFFFESTTEAQRDSDLDGNPDLSDGCPLDPAKSTPGACGCGRVDADANVNQVADCLDPNVQALAFGPPVVTQDLYSTALTVSMTPVGGARYLVKVTTPAKKKRQPPVVRSYVSSSPVFVLTGLKKKAKGTITYRAFLDGTPVLQSVESPGTAFKVKKPKKRKKPKSLL